jgi:hypothetical protein
VVSLDFVGLTEPELRQEVLKLRRRVQKLSVLLRLALALLRTSGFRLTGERLPDGRAETLPVGTPVAGIVEARLIADSDEHVTRGGIRPRSGG